MNSDGDDISTDLYLAIKNENIRITEVSVGKQVDPVSGLDHVEDVIGLGMNILPLGLGGYRRMRRLR
ncbi:MAG: hypothetical protein NTU88_12260 [Armatimonadetes bacterium]|nr:hypothetical protein [Armatimonadota bacterium]